MARLLSRLCILESRGYYPKKSLRRALAKLIDSLISNDLENSLWWCSVAVELLTDQMSRVGLPSVGPIRLAGLEFHGFVPGCSPATILNSLRNADWPRRIFFEHDIRSAFDTADLHFLSLSGDKLGIPNSISLALGIMRSRLVVRTALLEDKVINNPSFAAAAIKQFPKMTLPGTYKFNPNELIQGSPLSPILFIINLAATSLINNGMKSECPSQRSVVKGNIVKYWVYGDNVYCCHSTPPKWANCLWKEVNVLGATGITLGLEYSFIQGRLVVQHPHKPYQMGVQKILDKK